MMAEADGELISLNVRTIDQRTFPVSIRSGASVPQLKAAVAEETGVTLARQRLIFRGRVLKNDQPLSAYALEDGHTLHLVVRAEPAADAAAQVQAAADAAQAPPQGGAGRPAARARGSAGSRSARFLRAISRGRDNDEPDPMMAAGAPNRVLMGATITVPEGSDVNMPFLSSMIANIMNSVQDTVAGGGGVAVDDTEAGRGIRRVTWTPDVRAPGRTRHRVSSRSRRDRSDRAAHASSVAAGGQPGSGVPPQPVDRQVTLRARTALRLQNIQQTLENQEFDFQGVEHRQVDANVNSDASAFQAQLDQFVTLITQFNPRMQLLPVALSDNESLQDQTQNEQLVRSVVRAIETLQTIGESADLLSRVARHLFLRQSSRALEHLSRLDEGRRSRMWQSVSRSATERGADVGALSAAPAQAQTAPAAPTENGASPDEPSNVAPNPPDVDQAPEAQQQGPQSMLPPFLQTLLAGSRSFPVDLTGGQGLASAGGSTGEVSTGTAGPVPAVPSRAHGASRVSIAGMGLPLASVVFPISLSGINHSATTWNFGDLLSRLVSEIPSATLYGLLAGDPVSVHQMMAHVGFALVSGVDIPPVSRPAIRTWSTNLVNELRRQLRDHGIPSEILMEVDSSRRSAFVDELIRPLEPFIPELVDFFFRATSASRAAAFGTRSAEFLGTMARQFVTSFGEYLGGDAERINNVLRQLVVCLGMYENLAGFVVENFLRWAQASGATTAAASAPVSSTASRRRQRPANSSEPTIGPAAKRHRRP